MWCGVLFSQLLTEHTEHSNLAAAVEVELVALQTEAVIDFKQH